MVYSWLRKPQFLVFIPLVLLLVLALACGDDPTPTPRPIATPVPATAVPPTAVPPTATPAPTVEPPVARLVPKLGGIIPIQRGGTPATIDPHAGANIEAGGSTAPAYNGLLTYDPLNTSEVIGDLAKGWEVSSDGLEWTFKINKNIKWQDGVDLTADDIAFSIMRMIDSDAPRPKIDTLKTLIDRAEMIDQHTLRVLTKKPGTAFMSFLGLPYASVLPKHHLETGVDINVFDNVVGSGPFRGVERIEGVSFEWERNPDYWKEGQPYIDGLKIFTITDPGTVIATLKAGRTMMCNWACANVKLDDILRLQKDEEFLKTYDIWIMEGVSGMDITMNTRIEPFNDPRVRRALFLAAHRQSIQVGLGSGLYPIGYMMDPGSAWSLPMDEILSTPGYRELDGKNHPDDIAEAKALLKDAGQENFTGVLIGPTFGDIPDFIQLYAQQLKETLGIELEPRPIPLPDWITKSQQGDFFMTFGAYSPVILDPDDRFRALYSDTSNNWSGYTYPEIAELFAKQTAEPDLEMRKQTVFEMQRLVLAGSPSHLQFYWLVSGQIVNKRIITLAGQYVLPFRPNTGPLRHEHEWLEPE